MSGASLPVRSGTGLSPAWVVHRTRPTRWDFEPPKPRPQTVTRIVSRVSRRTHLTSLLFSSVRLAHEWELCKITSCTVTSEAGELQGSCLTRRTAIDVQTMIWQDPLLVYVLVDEYLVDFLLKNKGVVEHCLRSCPGQVQEVELETFTSRLWSKGEWTDGRDTCVCSGRVLFSAGSKRPLSRDCDHELHPGDLAKPHH